MTSSSTAPCNLLKGIPCYMGSTTAIDADRCNPVVCVLQQLNNENLRLSQLLGHLPGMAFRRKLPDHGSFEYVSDSCHAITGIAAEALRNDIDLWQQLIHADYREGVDATLRNAIAGHHAYQAIYKIRNRHDEDLWLWEQGIPLDDATTGNPIAIEGYVACLTTLANSPFSETLLNEQLSQIVQQSDQIFWVSSLQNNRIVYLSPAFEQIWGISREQMQRNPLCWLDAIDPQHRPSVELAMAVDFNFYGNKTVNLDYRINRPDGTQRWLRARFAPLFDRNGNLLGRGGTALDITEEKRLTEISETARHQLEEELSRRHLQLETLAREKSQLDKLAATAEMAAGIAHEINNPLAGIKNVVSLMKSAIPVDHPYLQFADMAERELERLTNITRQMYQLYQPTRESLRVIDLHQLAQETATLCQTELAAKGLRVMINCDPAGLRIALPENDMRQILLNILRNAIDVADPKSDISITGREADGLLQLAVTNRGPAIPQHLKDRIFEPFFTTKRGNGKGMGLGLAVCHSLATQHGGDIRVHCADGMTTFTVYLPA